MHVNRWLVGACLGLMAATGCKDDPDPITPPPPVLGNGTVGNIKPAAHDGAVFTAPLDATPSPDGADVYFTARNADGVGIFKASAAGGTITALHVGDPLSGPVGITVSSDNLVLFIADPGAQLGEEDQGVIWSLPTSGGTPTLLNGTSGYAPRGLTLMKEDGGDQLYFTGKTPDTHEPGVFKISTSGGTANGLAKGAPFSDPNGIAVTTRGAIYVMDNGAGNLNASDTARVIQVVDNTATVFQDGMKVGFPAGIALSQDDSVALISAIDPEKRTDVVIRLNLASKQQEMVSDVIGGFEESAGLHRAANSETYAWCDSSADGSGTVYVLTP
jgi:hypothetical protein